MQEIIPYRSHSRLRIRLILAMYYILLTLLALGHLSIWRENKQALNRICDLQKNPRNEHTYCYGLPISKSKLTNGA